MALIACPDCGKEISDQAAACIGCGRPMQQAHTSTNSGTVKTVRAGGAWEGLGFLIIVGAIFYGGATGEVGAATAIGAAGFVVFLIGRFR